MELLAILPPLAGRVYMSFQTKFLEFLPRTRVNRARGEASGEDILEAAKEDYRELIRAQGGPAGGNQDRSA